MALLVVAEPTIFSCHQWMLFSSSWRSLLSLCGGVCIVILMAYLTTVVLGLCYIVLSLGLWQYKKQAGAELGSAQLKLGCGSISVYLYQIDELEILFFTKERLSRQSSKTSKLRSASPPGTSCTYSPTRPTYTARCWVEVQTLTNSILEILLARLT